MTVIVMRVFVVAALVLCFSGCSDTSSPSGAEGAAPVGSASARITSRTMPDFSRFPGACIAAVGIAKGATQSHVDNFVQTYFGVVDGSPGSMHSTINSFALDGNVTVIKAGIYKMNDSVVDREMVSTFADGKLTQCGLRERCAANPIEWVADCD